MKKHIALFILLCLLLSACGASPAQKDEKKDGGFQSAPITAVAKPAEEHTVDPADLSPDPPYDFDIDAMQPSDFGDFFTGKYGCERSSYMLLPGDEYENEVTVIKGAQDGPTVYIIAGIHGDEEAAWQTGKLLKKADIKAGTLYILAPANRWGAEKLPKSRFIDGKDGNRAFPGDPNGTNAQRAAYSIFTDVSDKSPVFVFDLHEAIVIEDDRDYLGSSLIFTDMDLFGDLFMDLYFATEAGEICSMPFDCFSPGPAGSINNTVSTQLGIPTLTVETYRGYEMEQRISDQLDIVQYVLKYYGMV